MKKRRKRRRRKKKRRRRKSKQATPVYITCRIYDLKCRESGEGRKEGREKERPALENGKKKK